MLLSGIHHQRLLFLLSADVEMISVTNVKYHGVIMEWCVCGVWGSWIQNE